MGLPDIRHKHLTCWLEGGISWAHATSKCCWSILNHSPNIYSVPDTLYVYSYTNVCGIPAKVHLAYMKSLVLIFKDLRVLGSHFKAKRP